MAAASDWRNGKERLNVVRMERRRRRALVLTDEAARHPFLRSLPPHVRKAEPAAAPQSRGRWRITTTDLREFLYAYCACFMAAMAFIS